MPKTKGGTAPKRQRGFWRKGERQAVADSAGISLSYLSDLLAGRRFFSLQKMRDISRSSRKILGEKRAIAFKDLLTFNHVIFREG